MKAGGLFIILFLSACGCEALVEGESGRVRVGPTESSGSKEYLAYLEAENQRLREEHVRDLEMKDAKLKERPQLENQRVTKDPGEQERPRRQSEDKRLHELRTENTQLQAALARLSSDKSAPSDQQPPGIRFQPVSYVWTTAPIRLECAVAQKSCDCPRCIRKHRREMRKARHRARCP